MARVTDTEAQAYRRIASDADVTLSVWLRGAIAKAADLPPSATPHHDPVRSKDDLAAVLRHIGMIGSNVNQLARKANMGSWPEAEALQHAQQDIRMIRDQLMRALGRRVPDRPEP